MSGSSKGHPIFHLVVSAADGADDKRLQTALVEIAGQDPSVSINTQPQERLYSLEGRAESDLESVCDRLRDEYQLGINVGALKAVFLETIRKHAEAEGKYIRQTGGMGNYGHCKLRIDPSNPGKGYEFINDIRGGAVPNKYIKSIEKGVLGAMEMGILAGFPVVDVKVTLCDGSYHEGDSNEMAFKFAGSIAFKEAARKASPVLLEPVMAVEVTVPEEYMGVIIGDINSRRGRIEGMEHAAGSQVIKAIVPLKEMFGYVNEIRSSTQGRASYSMQFARYEEAPRMIADEIIGRSQGK